MRGREKGGDDICVFVVISLKLASIKVEWVSVSVSTFKESTVQNNTKYYRMLKNGLSS